MFRSRLPTLAVAGWLAVPTPALAGEPVAAVEHRFTAGVSAGLTQLGDGTGRSLDLSLALAIGAAAAIRIEAGETRFDGFGRLDRRLSTSLVFDLTRPLRFGRSVSLTPFVEGGIGLTRSEIFESTTSRPHLQGGGGLRLALGSRLSLSARGQSGVQRTPAPSRLAVDDLVAPLVLGERERYTRWHVAASLRF